MDLLALLRGASFALESVAPRLPLLVVDCDAEASFLAGVLRGDGLFLGEGLFLLGEVFGD